MLAIRFKEEIVKFSVIVGHRGENTISTLFPIVFNMLSTAYPQINQDIVFLLHLRSTSSL